MADLIVDLLDVFLTTTPGDRALRETRELGNSQSEQDHRIDVLESQVAALQRTVATLAEVLVRSGAVNEDDRRRVVRAAGRRHEAFTSDTNEPADEADAVVGSPYRGGAPVPGLRGCAVCGKRLVADDPELSLAAKGAVCTLCFTRGG